jgi:hypothetical protein
MSRREPIMTSTDRDYYQQWLTRKQREHGSKWDPSDLAPQFIQYFHSDVRIKVDGPMGVRTGTIGVTTGWRPVFLLMHRSSAHGSTDTLGRQDRIIEIVRVRRRGGRS